MAVTMNTAFLPFRDANEMYQGLNFYGLRRVDSVQGGSSARVTRVDTLAYRCVIYTI